MSHSLEGYQESNSFVGRLRSRDLSVGSRSKSQASDVKDALLEAQAIDSLLKYSDNEEVNMAERSSSITEKMWTKVSIYTFVHSVPTF